MTTTYSYSQDGNRIIAIEKFGIRVDLKPNEMPSDIDWSKYLGPPPDPQELFTDYEDRVLKWIEQHPRPGDPA